MMTSGQYDEAIPLLEAFVAKYPGRYDEAMILGKCYLGAGMFEEAIVYLEKARLRWAFDYQFTEMLGQAYLETGQREKAVEVWHSILTDKEKDVSRYLQVSRAEWNAGMYDRAIATLKEGRKFPRHYARFTAEIVRMEKTRGNNRGAFIESLPGYEMEETARPREGLRDDTGVQGCRPAAGSYRCSRFVRCAWKEEPALLCYAGGCAAGRDR